VMIQALVLQVRARCTRGAEIKKTMAHTESRYRASRGIAGVHVLSRALEISCP
jgi:hypothetical protein